ncbi:MAG: hypothetical protein AB2806_04485 [Candidatus Thiodiazotropha sp.]
MTSIPEPLRSVLNDYCHVEWAEELAELPHDIGKVGWAYDASLFKSQLKEAIFNLEFSLQDYEDATGEDFDSEDDLVIRLKEIWKAAFPNDEL